MPILSRFLGIVIAMYWDDHLPPHFHAKYGGYEITVEILTGVVEGSSRNVRCAMCLNGMNCTKMNLSPIGSCVSGMNNRSQLSHWSKTSVSTCDRGKIRR